MNHTHINYCCKETPESVEGDPDASESTAEGDTQIVYPDSLCSPNMGAVIKKLPIKN
jgi:hypothetical protein